MITMYSDMIYSYSLSVDRWVKSLAAIFVCSGIAFL
jgi:hypothetical protein